MVDLRTQECLNSNPHTPSAQFCTVPVGDTGTTFSTTPTNFTKGRLNHKEKTRATNIFYGPLCATL